MNSNEKNRFIVVVWSAARSFERQIMDEIGVRFNILRTFEITWPRRHFTQDLAAFYGWKSWFCWYYSGIKEQRGLRRLCRG